VAARAIHTAQAFDPADERECHHRVDEELAVADADSAPTAEVGLPSVPTA